MDGRFESVTPQQIREIRAQAEKMRAEAIRASFVEFTTTIKRGFSALTRAFRIPRTEQL